MRMAQLPVRGRPLVALVFVLLCWVGLRAASWDHPLFAPTSHDRGEARRVDAPRLAAGPVATRASSTVTTPVAIGRPSGNPAASARIAGRAAAAIHRRSLPVGRRANGADRPFWVPYAHPQNPDAIPPNPPTAAMTRALLAGDRPIASRWSGDAWLLLRRGGNVSLTSGPGFATYGASQAGAVLRYRLAPDNRHRPAAYLRATAALNGSGEREVAAGLSARPVAALPVAVLAEVRVTRQSDGTHPRPAAMAVTEFAPVDLPQRLRAEVYGQAGYVGGRYATAFVDGQFRLDRGMAEAASADLRLGAGVWGGAQKGASRLDLGPTASASLAASQRVFVRVAADWRFRVAGNAAPASGPALTLSAGF